MVASLALIKFLVIHHTAEDDLRMGQRFVSLYIPHNWPELFYEKDDGVAQDTIEQWLIDNSYCKDLPETNLEIECK